MNCPKCGEDCCRDEVDVGVGIIYGPYGCSCGWSEDPYYDGSDGPSPAAREHKNHYVDSTGGMTPHAAVSEGLKRFGLPGDDIINDVFKEKS